MSVYNKFELRGLYMKGIAKSSTLPSALCVGGKFCSLLLGLVFMAGCSDSQVETKPVLSQPNVVFILVDDMGFGDVGYNGSEIATPNLDQMASAGVRLDHNYVYPICSPTRAALLTAQNPLHHGIDGPMSDDTGLPLDLKIMPEYFKDLGYQTHMVGKWHLGIGNTDYWPTSRGFDSHYGFLGGWVDFYTHVYAGGLDWQRDGKSLREQGHSTDLFSAEAARVITERDPTKPFLLYLTYNAPHSPLQNPPMDSGLNDQIEPGHRSVYAEMVTHADAGIGRVIETLESEGILDNTIVVFSSDNGGSLGLGASNGELRGSKGSTLEGGMRVPGLVWSPGLIDGGRVLQQPIAVHDWLPTLLDAVGGDSAVVKNAYGQSMWSAIAEDTEVERSVITMGVRENRAVMDWPWKLVVLGNADQDEPPAPELYNVVTDPYEMNNLASAEPQKLAELQAVLNAMPVVESKQDRLGRGANAFYPDGNDYDARLQEARDPWAEAATIGNRARGSK